MIFVIIVFILLFINNNGSPFFVQKRPGLYERIFKILKFKTMNDKRIKRAQIVTIEGKLTKVLTTNDLLVMLTKERDTLTTTYYKIH